MGRALIKQYGATEYTGDDVDEPLHVKQVEELSGEVDRSKEIDENLAAADEQAAEAMRLSKRKAAQDAGVAGKRGRSKG